MERERIEVLEGFIEKFMTENEARGIAFSAINGNGAVIYEKLFGYQAEETRKAINGETIFGIASVTKSFTALSIMQMAEKGILKLTDPVSTYIKEFTDTRITILHFLSHTAGYFPFIRPLIVELRKEIELDGADPSTHIGFLEAGRKQICGTIDGVESQMTPGEYFSYSNEGFALLSEIVRLYGGYDSYEAYLQEEICGPLGMERTTTLFEKLMTAENVATRYTKYDGVWEATKDVYGNAVVLPGEGNIKSTIEDMKKYLRFYVSGGVYGDILSGFWLKELEKPRITMGNQQYYAAGLHVEEIGDVTVTGHSGSLPGASSYIAWSRDLDLGVVILCNVRGLPLSRIGKRYIELATYEAIHPAVTYTGKTWHQSVLNHGLGVYKSNEGTEFSVKKKENALYVEFEKEDYLLSCKKAFLGEFTRSGNPVTIEFLKLEDSWAARFGSRIIPKTM